METSHSFFSRYVPVVMVSVFSMIVGVCAASIYGHDLVVSVTAIEQHSENTVNLALVSLPYETLPLPGTIPAENRVIEKTYEAPAPVGCVLSDRMDEARTLLEPIALSVGSAKYGYSENRAGNVVEFSEPEKKIVLAVMDNETCVVQTTSVSQRGEKLVAPAGYDIEVVTRSNGIRWNNWATEFRITRPKHKVVIALKYPLVQPKKEIIPVYYTPYSQELHVPELVRFGEEYLEQLASRAYTELRKRHVPSNAVAGKMVPDVTAIRPEFFARLAPIEHMDMTEFMLDPAWTTERIHIVIGANRERVATYTCSIASACGLMQFTEGTYNLMREIYPQAGLIADFQSGARNQLNAMKAALLLHDYNTALLVRSFGKEILKDGRLEEFLAAAYNTGVGRVIAVLGVSQRDKVTDWAVASGSEDGEVLLNETKGYIAKLRYLRDEWRITPLALIEN